jgi:hypothetical protein
MANRSAKFASAIVASLLAGAPITIFPSGYAHAARDCLTKPGSEARQGQHWRYRIEHGTKRRCWFLTAMSGSITNAHDELRLPGAQHNGDASAAQYVRAMPSAPDSVSPVAPPSPEPLAVDSSANPAPGASEMMDAEANATPQADPSPPLAPVTLAADPALRTVDPLQMLLLTILGTLALASLLEEFIDECLVRLPKQQPSDVESLLLR